MKISKQVQGTAIALSLVAFLASGCNKQQSAIDAAKADVVKTGQPQEVIYTDGNGMTTTTLISPPAAGTTTPGLVSATAPVTAPTPSGLPDWSNGHRPPAKNVARYSAPGAMVGTVSPAEPGAATDPNAQPYAAANAAPVMSGAPAGGDAAEPMPANFVPTSVTLPEGTGLAIRINQRIDVKHAAPGERFSGELAESVRRDGTVILPRGTRFHGEVTAAHRRGHFKGRSVLALSLTSMEFNGKEYPLETANFVASKKGKGKRTAGFIAGTAGVGMLVGGIASGGVGLAVGGLAGGGLGTLLAGATGNRDIVIPAESLVRFRLADDLTVQPPADAPAVATR